MNGVLFSWILFDVDSYSTFNLFCYTVYTYSGYNFDCYRSIYSGLLACEVHGNIIVVTNGYIGNQLTRTIRCYW